MTNTLKYLGDAPFREEQVTGSKRVWNYGQTMTIDSTVAAILVTTGLFEQNAPVVEIAEHAAEHTAMGVNLLSYKGTWNATTNSPHLATGVGTQGDFYIVGVAGTSSIDGGATWAAGDTIAFNGSAWQRVPLTITSDQVVAALTFTPAPDTALQPDTDVAVTSVESSARKGTPGTGVTAAEFGDGRTHMTVLTLATGCVLPAIAGGAALGVGTLLYTLPAGAQLIEASYLSVAVTQSQGHINTDQPVIGLGSVIASGVISNLDGTGTFKDLVDGGQAAANCTGTATVKTSALTGVPFITEAAGSKHVYLNAAATWSASGDAAAALSGTVTLCWRSMSA